MVNMVEMENMVSEDEITVRIKINKSLWATIKSMAVYRQQSVQKFATDILKFGYIIVANLESYIEEALEIAEEKFIENGFRILRGGAIIFKQDRILHMELMKNNLTFHFSYIGLWANRDSDYTIAGMVKEVEDLKRFEIPEDEKKDIIKVLDICQNIKFEEKNLWDLFSEYYKLGISREIVR